jgi:chemotaxis protein methyltransferase CheR
MNGMHPACAAVLRLLGERTGLAFPETRQPSAAVGISRAMARAGVTDLHRYRSLLERDADALDDLISELTVGETYFFREPAQFEFIRRRVLPDLRLRRGPEPSLRVWSAGCASGEEAYSLAILFRQEGLGGRVYLLASDISRAALARAHRAAYSNWSLRGEGAAAAAPYLSRRGNLHVLDDTLRRDVTFAYLNLALDVYPSFATGTWGMDLILCRNVLIYFDSGTVRSVARRLFAALAPGGWLLTASSDPLLADHAGYETVVTDTGVFYRRPATPAEVTSPAPLDEPEVPEPGWSHRWHSGLADVPPEHQPEASARTHQPEAPGPLPEAEAAFACGDYVRAAKLTRDLPADALASTLHIRSLANLETIQAERACAEAVRRHPLCVELHYLHAVLLLELGRDPEAAQAARRVIYLDRSLAIGHLTLGSILWRRGDLSGARRAFRNARDLCAVRPAGEQVPLSEGESAGRLAEVAAAQLAILDATGEATS